jgi:regulation of enolase protein 1 (concanavalin A-like superfamily)
MQSPCLANRNHDVVAAKTRTVGCYYSLDHKTWQLIRLFKNDYPDRIWLGVSAQSPLGNGASASFEDLSLLQTSIADFRLGE